MSSDSINQTKSKPRRRRLKREGSPQLQFLVATDPSQFRDEHAKRSVRSQAMIHWRHEEDKIKRKGGQKDKSVPSSSAKSTTQGGTVTSLMPTRTRRLESFQDAPISELSDPQNEGHRSASSIICSNSLNTSTGYNRFVDAGSSSWQLTATETASYFPEHKKRASSTKYRSVIDYEETENHEERQIRALIVGLATFYNVSSFHDPFDVFPQFRNQKLDSLYLSRNCKFPHPSLGVIPDIFRCARVCFGLDNEEMVTISAIASTPHP